jgi:hypothetical protein
MINQSRHYVPKIVLKIQRNTVLPLVGGFKLGIPVIVVDYLSSCQIPQSGTNKYICSPMLVFSNTAKPDKRGGTIG